MNPARKNRSEQFIVLSNRVPVISTPCNPELVGWRELMNRIRESAQIQPGDKIGIIVDSELCQLSAIKQRTAPVLGDRLLPDGFEFLYASADVGPEYPHNKLLRICDKTSSNVSAYVAQHQEILGRIETIDNEFIDGQGCRFDLIPLAVLAI